MAEAYAGLKKDEQPIFVTTDALLHTAHLFFDYLLRIVEWTALRSQLVSLTEMLLEAAALDLAQARDRQVKEAARRKKIIVLLNFPQNPTGYTATEAEGDEIVRILLQAAQSGTQVIAVFDDAYFGLFYDAQALRESLFARLAQADPRLLAVKLDGATKENFVWGLRIGFVTYGTSIEGDPQPVYDALEKKTAGCVRGNISNASHLSQSILLKSMQDPRNVEEKAEKFDILRRRAARVKEVLADPKYGDAWEAHPFNSGYFMCLRLKTVDAEALRVHLLDAYGVGLISLLVHALVLRGFQPCQTAMHMLIYSRKVVKFILVNGYLK